MKFFSLLNVRLGILASIVPPVVVAMSPVVAMVLTPGMAIAQATTNQATAGRSDAMRSDALIESEVTGALHSSAVLKSQQITAATIEGNVTLSGNVSDAASKELAGMLVLRVSGVKAVENNLAVGGQQAADTGAQVADNDGEQLPPPQEIAQNSSQNAATYGPDDMGPPPAPDGPRPPYADTNRHPQYPQDGPPEQASGPVQIPQGTLLKVRLSEFLDARHVKQGTMFEATAANDVYSGGVLAIPRGATLDGQVVDIRSTKGSLGGSQSATLKLNSLVLGGKTYSLDTDVWVSNGPGKGGYTAGNTVTGAAVGAIIGGIAGGGIGAGIGAAAGGVTGAVGSAATSGPRVLLPPEAVLTFHLANAVTVQPVGQREAQRLASAAQHSPSLQHRPGYVNQDYGYPGYDYPDYGYPDYPPPPIAYGYPYGYYSPRYRGGYYYGGYFGR